MLDTQYCADYLAEVRQFADAMDALLEQQRCLRPSTPEMSPVRKAIYARHPEAAPKSLSVRQQLEERLDYLGNYGNPGETTCVLHKDWAPRSFEFAMMKGDQRWFVGGLIYHGPQLDGSTVDPLSIEISPSDGPHWSVHT